MDHKELLETVFYDEVSGKIYWRHSVRNAVKAGEEVGSKTKTGYIECRVLGVRNLLHRLIWFYKTGSWPLKTIDHINRIRDDNRWCNLREASYSENNINKPPTNSLKIKNVYLHKGSGKYNVKLFLNKKTVSFGYYEDLELADLVASEARAKYQKEFAYQTAN